MVGFSAGNRLSFDVGARAVTLSASNLALFRALTPITRKVIDAGDVPAATPMGLSRHDLHDDSAHLA